MFKEANRPVGVFMVAKAGKPIYQKAFGKANVELNVNMNTANIFQLASITKQFTAIAILILEEKGKLSTKDPISKFIPDYPNGNQITIHQLLNHTSGIKDFTKLNLIAQIAQQDLSPKELVDFF
ncbi:serine hydrolase domain-containing protein [Pedobacter helvus]|uniref:Serine hydrolase domain-containing protein n=1 Tax=Pedobacter helvus TaxID=2563444 RepID=A0ABW9JDQ3_9SPHI|nr:serine hydrolase domain-containing protein [Pedobacter ureilyticus]